MEIVGVRVEVPANQPLVLLRERDGGRYLPIWIGAAEATAIAFAQQGVQPPRPMTHDLMRDLLAALGRTLAEVRITELSDGVFYALLVLDGGVEVSARPSDAIALALRTDTPVVSSEDVLDEAGIELPAESAEEGGEHGEEGEGGPPADEQVERFRAFLDQVSPEDFGSPES